MPIIYIVAGPPGVGKSTNTKKVLPDFINWVRKFYPNYKIQVILFFTDDIQLCLDRAYLRQLAGGHTVEPDIVERMYKNTISLLRANIYKISYLQFIHTDYNSNELVYSGYYPTRKVDFVHENLPDWVKNSFPEIG